MLNAAGSLRWFRDALAPGLPFDELVGGGGEPPARSRRGHVPPVSPGRADSPRRPVGARAVRGAVGRARPRGTRPRGARRRCVRPPRLPRAAARAGRASARRSRVRRRGAQPPLARDRRVGARAAVSSAWPSRRGRPTEQPCSPASRPASSPTRRRRCAAASTYARRSSRTKRWAKKYDERLRSLSHAVSGAERARGLGDGRPLGVPLDRRHQPEADPGSAGVGEGRPDRRREPRPGACARRTRASGASSARTARTRRCSRIQTSRRSTSRSRTRCTWSGRFAPSRPESTSSARSRSTAAPDEVERAFDAAERAGRLLCGGVHVSPQPADARGSSSSSATGAIGELRVIRVGLQLRALRRRQHPPAHGRRGRQPDGRRLLLRQRVAAARRRARVGLRLRLYRAERNRLDVRGHDALPRRRARALRLRHLRSPSATSWRRSAPRARSSSTTPGTAQSP